MKRVLKTIAKTGLVAGTYIGEIAWQKAGAPGREAFEPLQHVGNLGLSMGVPALGAVGIDAFVGGIKREPFERTARTLPRKKRDLFFANALKERLDMLNIMYASVAVAGIGASIYAETFGEGTHDIVDAAYGSVGTLVAMGLVRAMDRPGATIRQELAPALTQQRPH